jgi:hypothetical protein
MVTKQELCNQGDKTHLESVMYLFSPFEKGGLRGIV